MKKGLLLIVLMVFGWVGVASAVPVQFADNGHYYEVMTTFEYTSHHTGNTYELNFNSVWSRADMYSDDYSYLGETSYFATITSADENAFVASLVSAAKQTAFLGGRQNESLNNGADGWYWAATGEAMTYFNWAPGEPNDVGCAGEDYLEMYANGTWNDVAFYNRDQAYVVEYDGAPVPEPATLVLLGSGLAGLAFYRRKRK